MNGYQSQIDWNIKNREHLRKYKAMWYRKNKGRCQEYQRIRYLVNKEKIDKQNIKNYYAKQYGITLEQKEERLKIQLNRCAICTRELTMRTANVDHDHVNKRFRGILCNPCNQGLGLFQDDLTFLENAINYLER